MFKLPIQYVNHHELPSSVAQDLELVDVHGLEPICDKVFLPTTEEAKRMARESMRFYTTNTTFLKESIQLYRKPFQSIDILPFTENWDAMKNNKEFKTTYHYIESSWLSGANYSPAVLLFISAYFVSSPIICILTPFVMLLIPFVLLHSKGTPLTWDTYYELFKQVASTHSLGKLFFKFGESNPEQRMYIVLGAVFFAIQVYANVYNFYTFYMNMRHTIKVLTDTESYLKGTIDSMKEMEKAIEGLSTYTSFGVDIVHHREKLESFYQKISPVTYSSMNAGILRAHFYELYDNSDLEESLVYSVSYHGFLQNSIQMSKNLKKRMKECSFGTKTMFKRAYYPIDKPIKNSYEIKNMILTGPNASGKTTFIKTTMINTILSQQFGCGFYRSATIQPYDTFFSYINIPDTSGRDSLFQAEARRCKEIVDHLETNERTLCIFDELFSGTNPVEATSSTIALLSYLAKYPTFTFLLTTHFTDVCESMKDSIPMYRMKTDIKPLRYHYKMEKGISYVRGGNIVLETMGFPEEILKHGAVCG
jgi:hypothetical protein